jgi:hypothetical protein
MLFSLIGKALIDFVEEYSYLDVDVFLEEFWIVLVYITCVVRDSYLLYYFNSMYIAINMLTLLDDVARCIVENIDKNPRMMMMSICRTDIKTVEGIQELFSKAKSFENNSYI